MAKSSSPLSHFKVCAEPNSKTVRSSLMAIGSLPEVLRAFQRTTGWSLQYDPTPALKSAAALSSSAPVNPGVGTTLGHLTLGPADATTTAAPVSREAARELAAALSGMLDELVQVRRALVEREAELAAGVPLLLHREGEAHLATRLEAVLRGGAEALGCHAAALYLLDEATSKLKLRACWGLPLDRLTAPPRPLQGAVADLESLLGHAVVLEDPELMRHWHVPEDFPAAACVPVSSPTTILGTLWMFSNTRRDFTDQQTNILEVVAGRVASDLEREMLWQEGAAAAELKKQVAAAERLQRNQLPAIAPVLDDWDLAGWTAQGSGLGGDFHDWFCLPDGLLAVAVGHAMDGGVSAALSAAALKAALRAHGQYHREAQQTLKRLNLTLWTGSAGGQHAALYYGLIETATGRICSAAAGRPGVVHVRPRGWESLGDVTAKLGEGPQSTYEQFGAELQPGEALVLFTDGVRESRGPSGRALDDAGIAHLLEGRLDLPASELLALIRQCVEVPSGSIRVPDRTIFVIKRRP